MPATEFNRHISTTKLRAKFHNILNNTGGVGTMQSQPRASRYLGDEAGRKLGWRISNIFSAESTKLADVPNVLVREEPVWAMGYVPPWQH